MPITPTRIIRNDNPDEDHVLLGTVWKISVWLGGIASIVVGAIIIAGVLRLFAMSATLDRIDERTVAIDKKADAANALAASVKNELDLRVRMAEEQHLQFLTKDQYYHDMAPEVKRRIEKEDSRERR